MATRAHLRSWPIMGTVAGASAILAVACSPAGGMSGMRADLVTSRAPHAGTAAGVSPVTEVSKGCTGQNAEVETATGAPHYVYDLWIGCAGIGFARSTDGGLHFGKPMTAPGIPGRQLGPVPRRGAGRHRVHRLHAPGQRPHVPRGGRLGRPRRELPAGLPAAARPRRATGATGTSSP